MEIYKIKHNERINYVDHWVKSLQIFITVAMAFIGGAIYSGNYIVLVVLPFLESLLYLIQAVFVWIIFLTDDISFRAICSINSTLGTDLFGTEESNPGPLKDLDIYASTEYEKMNYKRCVGLLGSGVIITIYILCSIFGVVYAYKYSNNNIYISAILIILYALCFIVMMKIGKIIEEDKRKRREENYEFLNSTRPCYVQKFNEK